MKRFKSLAIVLLALSLALALCACGQQAGTPSAGPSDPAQTTPASDPTSEPSQGGEPAGFTTIQEGKLVMSTNAAFPPYEMTSDGEGYKGTGIPDYYCTPHSLNTMLLARDRNGRKLYNGKADIITALNVKDIYTAEQFDGLVRTDDAGKKHELIGIFVNLEDYTVGCVKGGEITRFEQFDIDFNQNKQMIETRLSGALTRIASAIVLEMPVSEEAA